MRKTALLSLLTAISLTACTGATTSTPTVSKGELARERQEQQSYVKNNGGNAKSDNVVVITKSMGDEFRQVAQRVGVAGEEMCKELGRKKCVFGFKLEEDSILNAYADGNNIVVSSAMAQFTDIDELANVLSHEYAHNMMSHVKTQTQNVMVGGVAGALADILAASQGYDTGGTFSKLGQSAGVLTYSKDFEREADYVGLYIMNRAGYDVTKAPGMWRKMSAADPNGIYNATTHPANPERYVALNKTIEEIKDKQARGVKVVPNFRK